MSASIRGVTLEKIDINHAAELVPPEFPIGWKWFSMQAGKRIERLPFGKFRPEGLPMPLARQAAIHCPSYSGLPSKGAGKKRYALSVYSLGQSVYADGDARYGSNGTWMLDYHEQRGNDPNQDYNQLLFNCLYDGVPIGVMVRSRSGGYDVLGLAAVEAYDTSLHTFLLHGPIRMADMPRGESISVSKGHAATDNAAVHHRASSCSDRLYDDFRSTVFNAYGGACAITETDVLEVLDIAYITNRREQLPSISNAILLRADICRLYEADLLSITPVSHIVRTSRRLDGTGYGRLDGCDVRLPAEPSMMPDEGLLDMRYQMYLRNEAKDFD